MNKHLVIIIRNTLQFLTLNESLELLLLNKTLRTMLDTPWFSVQLSLKMLQHFEEETVTESNCLEILARYGVSHLWALSGLFDCVKSSYNLLRNPCGVHGFIGWELGVSARRRHSLVIERHNTWNKQPTVFVGTYYWTSLSQSAQIPASDTHRLLVVGTPVARRHDCKSLAKVEALVFDETGQVYAMQRVQQECSSDSKYRHLFVAVILLPGAAYTLVARFFTKDMQFWAGNYGARLGYLYARVFNLSNPL